MGTQMKKPLAVVTGASSGIGLELARCCAANGFDLCLIAEDTAIHDVARELSQAGTVTYAHAIDLSTYDGVERAWSEIQAIGRPVDALLLNAGVGVGGDFTRETDLQRELAMISLNCNSVIHFAKRALPTMVARGAGRVLITSSVTAVMPASGSAVYGATKAFELAFAEAIRDELRDTGVTVTALQPNATETDFFRRAGMEHMKVAQEKKDDAALVAKQGFEAMMRGDDKVYAGSLKSRLMGILAEFLPEPAKARQHGKMTEPADKPSH